VALSGTAGAAQDYGMENSQFRRPSNSEFDVPLVLITSWVDVHHWSSSSWIRSRSSRSLSSAALLPARRPVPPPLGPAQEAEMLPAQLAAGATTLAEPRHLLHD
jgi:hypothetical protein